MADPTDDTPGDEPDQPENDLKPKPKGISIEDVGCRMDDGEKPAWTGVDEWTSTPEEERRLYEEARDRYRSSAAERFNQQVAESNAQRLQHIQETAKRSERAADATVRGVHLAAGSNRLAAIAVALSGLAFITSCAGYRLAFSDDEHDRRWRVEQSVNAAAQLRALHEIRNRLPPTGMTDAD